MKEFKGTTGPWFVGDELKVFTDEGRYICRQSVGLPDEKAEANAHLIAAAPELLKELQRLRTYVIDVCGADDEDCHAEHPLISSKVVIHKALGETK